MKLTYRTVVPEDYDAIFALWNSTEQSRRALNPVDDTREGITRYLKRNPTTCFLAAEEDDAGTETRVAGVILTGHDGRRGIIHHMCVHPDCRRQGIASALIRELLRRAEALGLAFVTLEVRAGNAPAAALYGGFGFEPVGRRRNYYDAPKEDAILMTKYLK